jgi:hypothetical protein
MMEQKIGKKLGHSLGVLVPEAAWSLRGDSSGIGHHLRCHILAAPCSASSDRIATHAAST